MIGAVGRWFVHQEMALPLYEEALPSRQVCECTAAKVALAVANVALIATGIALAVLNRKGEGIVVLGSCALLDLFATLVAKCERTPTRVVVSLE